MVQPLHPARPAKERWPVATPFVLLLLLLPLLLLAGCRPPSGLIPAIPGEMATLLPPVSVTKTAMPQEPTANDSETEESTAVVTPTYPFEHSVMQLPLGPALTDPELEFSGMAWHGDRLILLPQYPSRYGNQIFALERQDILAYLRGESDAALTPSTILFDDGGLSGMITGFEGYESIAFEDDAGPRVYLTIETRPGNWMLGYVLSGEMAADGSALTLAPMQRAPVPVQATLGNMTDESLMIDGDRILTLYEANGIGVNANPIANVYSLEMEKVEPIPFPNVEYRITDATSVDEAGRFWAINYFFPNDSMLLPESDPLIEQFGEGATHQKANQVERLVEFQIEADGIRLVDAPPIQLELSPFGLSRNWEGIARLQDGDLDGFLLVTDKFPSTQLAFVGR